MAHSEAGLNPRTKFANDFANDSLRSRGAGI